MCVFEDRIFFSSNLLHILEDLIIKVIFKKLIHLMENI